MKKQSRRRIPTRLAIDIGNSQITMALFHKKHLIRKKQTTLNTFQKDLKALIQKQCVDLAAVCSVVPSTTKRAVSMVEKITKAPVKVVQHNLKLSIRTRRYPKSKLGQDRLVNIWGARLFYPKKNVLIVDFGTAITVDFLSRQGVFEGGMILPGLQMALDSLHHTTALLPWVKFKPKPQLLGRDTRSGMQSGIFWGWVSMISSLVKLHEKKQKGKVLLLLTGGMSPLFAPHIQHSYKKLDPAHTLRSLNAALN